MCVAELEQQVKYFFLLNTSNPRQIKRMQRQQACSQPVDNYVAWFDVVHTFEVRLRSLKDFGMVLSAVQAAMQSVRCMFNGLQADAELTTTKGSTFICEV
jgi:hypothetical protein